MNATNKNQIRKVNLVRGKKLEFRNAKVTDAEFIFSLRIDRDKSKYLSRISPEMDDQVYWLENYADKNDQVYFIIQDANGIPLGTVRIYDAKEESFCWGSWILKNEVPKSAALESTLMVYSYAIDYLGFEKAHFDVRKDNEKVWHYHERFGAERIGETELDYFYKIDNVNIRAARSKYKEFLPENVTVEQ